MDTNFVISLLNNPRIKNISMERFEKVKEYGFFIQYRTKKTKELIYSRFRISEELSRDDKAALEIINHILEKNEQKLVAQKI
jgi:hypothetical protein